MLSVTYFPGPRQLQEHVLRLQGKSGGRLSVQRLARAEQRDICPNGCFFGAVSRRARSHADDRSIPEGVQCFQEYSAVPGSL